MASWRFTALAVLLAGIQSVLCVDEVEHQCNVTKATTCYWAEAMVHGANVLLPREKRPYPDDVCRTQHDFPEASVCEDYYGACTDPDKELFVEKEVGYAQLRSLLLNKTMCEGVKKLSTCIDRQTMGNCTVKLVSDFSSQNAMQNEAAARNLSECLQEALKPCLRALVGEFMEYMQNVAAAVEHLYKHKEQPVTPTEPITTASSTTVEPPTSTAAPANTSTTEGPATTHEPVSPTTQEPVTATTGVPPTTQSPPGAASTAQAVGAFGVVALAWLAQAA